MMRWLEEIPVRYKDGPRKTLKKSQVVRTSPMGSSSAANDPSEDVSVMAKISFKRMRVGTYAI